LPDIERVWQYFTEGNQTKELQAFSYKYRFAIKVDQDYTKKMGGFFLQPWSCIIESSF
jgi:hypothetical protein